MSDNLIDGRSRFAREAGRAAMIAARREVVERAREFVLPKAILPANDRDPATV